MKLTIRLLSTKFFTKYEKPFSVNYTNKPYNFVMP